MQPLTAQQALNLAMEYHRSGRFADAESLYRQLLALHPDSVDVIHLLGLVARDTQRYPEALEWMERSIAAAPHISRYRNNYGVILSDCDRLDESAAQLETACQLEPGNAEAHYNLGNTRSSLRQWDAAISAYQNTLRLAPQHLQAWLNLGLALNQANRREEAIRIYEDARRILPREAPLLLNLGNLYQDSSRLDEAIATYQNALELAPDSFLALNNLAVIHKERGDIIESISTLRRSLGLELNADVQSNLIFTLLYDPETSSATIATEQQVWNERFAIPLRSQRLPHSNDRSPERRLRIGYVSCDLRNHVVGRTLLPVFEAHDCTQVECVCYASFVEDPVTERFRAGSALWRDMTSWSDDQLAAQIRADSIDILVDLSLHTAYNRLPAFAREPAPVQLSWLGYPGATGTETLHHWLSDRFLSPPQQSSPATGTPIRLPDAWCCYPAPENSPDISPLPSASTGQITFGCFNNFAKINERVLQLWARILHAVPGSRLQLLTKAGSHRDRVAQFMENHGISFFRLLFLGYEPPSPGRNAGHYLQRYAEVDIALDPFPYNGMTTTCDALWMGVPVVALTGTLPISRASFSILSNLGLPELSANTEDDYVRTAVSLALDPPRLAALRASLREKMLASPLLDAPRFARNLESTYRQLWRDWCRTSHP